MPVVLTTTLVSTPAWAQTTITADELSAIQASLSTALQHATTDAEKEAAISQALQAAINQYGSGAAGAITSAVMNVAEQAGVSYTVIGTALARAAGAMAGTNYAAASSIATTLANEGKTAEIVAFQSTTTSLGYTNLASLAGAGATPTGEIGGGGGLTGGGIGGGFTGGAGGGGGGGGCLNPSCTRL